jgi:hypothetical protein
MDKKPGVGYDHHPHRQRTVFFYGLFCALHWPELRLVLKQLQLRLDKFCWVGDASLDRA